MALRKHPEHVFPLDHLATQGVFTAEQLEVLSKSLAQHRRLFFMGGVGVAKTTVVNSCLHAMRDDRHQAVMIMEDDPEIICTIPDHRRIWGVEELFSLKDMVQDSLRAMPTLIVVGEVRDGATALAMLRAFQTGHGGMTTVHAESVDFGLARIEQLVQEVSANPQRELIGQVIDLIVHMEHDQAARRAALHGHPGGEGMGWVPVYEGAGGVNAGFERAIDALMTIAWPCRCRAGQWSALPGGRPVVLWSSRYGAAAEQPAREMARQTRTEGGAMLTKTQNRVGMGVLLAGLALAEQALANVGGGGSRILGTDFLVELATVMTSVWIPVICLGTVVGVLAGLGLGRLRMSDGISKWVLIIAIAGFGVSGVASMLGLNNTAIALVG